jgi:hypothetical protein
LRAGPFAAKLGLNSASGTSRHLDALPNLIMRSGVARLEMFSKEKKPPEGGSQFNDRGSGGDQCSF